MKSSRDAGHEQSLHALYRSVDQRIERRRFCSDYFPALGSAETGPSGPASQEWMPPSLRDLAERCRQHDAERGQDHIRLGTGAEIAHSDATSCPGLRHRLGGCSIGSKPGSALIHDRQQTFNETPAKSAPSAVMTHTRMPLDPCR